MGELLTFDRWVSLVDGKYVDIDGAHGGQCWDTFADLCISVWGIPPINTWGGTWAGWAYAIWDQYHVNGAALYFDRIPATEPARPADVAIWTDKHWYYPASHIAPVLADAGGELYCMSQNSTPPRPWQAGYHPEATGPNTRQKLTKQGLAGYLRRKSITPAGPAPALPKEWDEMANPKEIVDALAPAIRKIVQEELADLKPGISGRRHSGESYNLIFQNLRNLITDPAVMDKQAMHLLHRPVYLVDPTGKTGEIVGTTNAAMKIRWAAHNDAQNLNAVVDVSNKVAVAHPVIPAETAAGTDTPPLAADTAPAVEHG